MADWGSGSNELVHILYFWTSPTTLITSETALSKGPRCDIQESFSLCLWHHSEYLKKRLDLRSLLSKENKCELMVRWAQIGFCFQDS